MSDVAGMRGAMRRVEILPDHVANQIAAGEVVERPASVVKELIENALDAGAQRIEIALRGGGKSEVRVTDDGHGMDRADAVLALDRHATSKIRSAEDLRSIASFGFRGEALPSIAAVSRFELHTAGGEGVGTRARVDFGRIRSVEEVPRRRGTTVTVKSLFHDLPARAKFLRTSSAETRASSEAVLLLALTHPSVALRLESNGRPLLELEDDQEWIERIESIWGDLASTLVPAVGEPGSARVSGLVQRPDAARPRGGRRYLFVNGRPFRDKGLNRIVDEAYRTTVAEGMRPSFFLRIDVDPATIDVNVHPAKSEVRFRDRQLIEEAVHAAVLAALSDLASTRPVEADPSARRGVARRAPNGGQSPSARGAVGAPGGLPQLALFVSGGDESPEAGSVEGGDGPEALAYEGPEIWQLHDRYILAATRDGLLIVDQHSAHERVLYEEIMDRFRHGGATSQALLFPQTLRLSPAEATAVEELAGLLARQGFELEPFGERTYILRASPQPHARFDAERCLREMIRELTEGSPLVDSVRNQHERIAKSMACKGAIKAGERLSAEEMRELFDRLFATELPGHDVHGRPTIVRLTIDELDRRFDRS
ncbi:MAG: DNA mismatch repair endonuclease MutL [Gemmatimonadota bacterium]|nr:DNA mismatch repair endonuclease MutL [Gemmatimonadota bacterium]